MEIMEAICKGMALCASGLIWFWLVCALAVAAALMEKKQ